MLPHACRVLMCLLGLPVALAVPALAQGLTTPSHFTSVEGSNYEQAGPGTNGPNHRFLQIYGELQGSARTIQRLRFRRDGIAGATISLPSYSILCDLIVSTAVTSTTAPSATFDQNHGTDRAVLGSNLLMQFPPTMPGPAPRPFEINIPLPQPFAFGGTGPLCFEMRVTSNTSTGVFLDVVSSLNPNPIPNVYEIGTGCRITGNTQPARLGGSGTANWVQSLMTLNLSGSRLPQNSLIYLSLGFNPNQFGGLPLPLVLPGTAGSPSGACTLYHDSLIQIPQLTNANGASTSQLPFPVNLSMNGANVYLSAIGVDAQANNWGLILTNAVRFELVTPYAAQPVAMVRTGSLGATGSSSVGTGLVTRFE